MAKIVKTADAPEGKVEVVYAGGVFTVDGRGYKTDDAVAVAAAETIPYLEVEAEDSDAAIAAAEKDNEERTAVRVRAEKAETKRVSKDPITETAPEKSVPGQETKETDD